VQQIEGAMREVAGLVAGAAVAGGADDEVEGLGDARVLRMCLSEERGSFFGDRLVRDSESARIGIPGHRRYDEDRGAGSAAVKAANVQLIEIRLAMALGGKAFVTLTGDVAAVESAVGAAAQIVDQKGLLVNKVVIPRPRPELLNEMI
jgi:hypothetical protein